MTAPEVAETAQERDEPAPFRWMMPLMAKWICPCGNEIRSSGSIPNPQEWHIVSDLDAEKVATAAALNEDADIVNYWKLSRLVYRCDFCDRLHIYWDQEQTWPPTIYTRESRAGTGSEESKDSPSPENAENAGNSTEPVTQGRQ